MPFTLWHRDQLIGETEFEGEGDITASLDTEGRHLSGIFRPTPYGRRMLPRLCGILTAGFELEEEVLRRGFEPDAAPVELLEELFATTAAGAHIIDIGRALSEVFLRDPSGVRLQVATMGFIELAELARLSRQIDPGDGEDLNNVPPETGEFVVSVTLSDLSSAGDGTMPLQ